MIITRDRRITELASSLPEITSYVTSHWLGSLIFGFTIFALWINCYSSYQRKFVNTALVNFDYC